MFDDNADDDVDNVESVGPDDPGLAMFLDLIAEEMRAHPERIRALDLEGLGDLLAGVEYDPDERLPDDFSL